MTSVNCGKTQIGSSDFGVKAQGKFCLVSMKVKNIGDKPQTLFGDNQKLFVGDAEYGANAEAGIYLDDSQTFIEEINPGNSLTGIVVFDVPKNAKPQSSSCTTPRSLAAWTSSSEVVLRSGRIHRAGTGPGGSGSRQPRSAR